MQHSLSFHKRFREFADVAAVSGLVGEMLRACWATEVGATSLPNILGSICLRTARGKECGVCVCVWVLQF